MKKFVSWILYPESHLRLAMGLSLPLLIVLSMLIFSMIRWEKKSLDDIQTANMQELSRAFYNHVIATDIWFQNHGGMYVEALQHAGQQRSQRPLSIMGKEFVNISPSMLTNQIRELLEKRSAYLFHITSLQPSSEAGVPDTWEAMELREFKKGKKEASEVVEVNNRRYFRYMAPLKIDARCIQCHESKGNTLPDIVMGGLSLEIPLGTADRIFAAQLKKSILSFATFGILVLLSVMLLTLFLSKRISDVFRERERQRETLKNLNSRLSLLSARDQAILGSIVDGIAIISEEGIVENVNDAFTRCTGIEAETLRRKHISSFSGHPVLDAVFSSPAPGELNLRNRVFVLAEVPVYGADGNRLLCILRILHDATDEKLSAAMELAGTAAHEVRQPLAILMGISDMVREKARRGEDASEELEILGQQITRINDIISKMLKITKYRTKPYTEETRIFDLE